MSLYSTCPCGIREGSKEEHLRTAHSPEGRDYAEAFDILVDVQSALVLTANFSDGATVASFVSSSTQYDRLNKFLHARQDVDPRSLPEGRSNGAGDDALKTFKRAASLFAQWRSTIMVRFDGPMDSEQWRALNKAFELLAHAATLTAAPTSEERLRSAAQAVLDGLDRRIEAASLSDGVPIFEGIADLRAALSRPNDGGER